MAVGMASGAGAWPLAEEAVEAGPSGPTSVDPTWSAAAEGCQPRRLQAARLQAGLQRLLLRRQRPAAEAVWTSVDRTWSSAAVAAQGCQPRRLQALLAQHCWLGLQRRLLLRRQRPAAARGSPLHAIGCKWSPAPAAWAPTATGRCMQGNAMCSFSHPSSSPATSHTVSGQRRRPEAVSTYGAERCNLSHHLWPGTTPHCLAYRSPWSWGARLRH